MSSLDLFPIKSRLAEVPAPPWGEFCESGDWWIQQCDAEWSPIGESICNSGTEDMTCAVATFIEHAPTDMQALIAEVERLRALLDDRARTAALLERIGG